MTPAINLLKKNKIDFKIHKYEHESHITNYGLEAASKLGLDESRVYKTLLCELTPKQLVVGIIPVNKSISLKQIAKSFNVKSAKMANKDEASKVTGYLLGGISAFGQKKQLKTLLDDSSKNYETIFVSGGKRGLDIEIKAEDIISVLNANYADIGI
jgi:Cys-tRNA(Pro)/Cys-tRNA(Cys) deacylase